MDEPTPVKYSIDLKSEGATKLHHAIVEQLKVILQDDYTDDALPQYIVMLLNHATSREKVLKELGEFLDQDVASFVDWTDKLYFPVARRQQSARESICIINGLGAAYLLQITCCIAFILCWLYKFLDDNPEDYPKVLKSDKGDRHKDGSKKRSRSTRDVDGGSGSKRHRGEPRSQRQRSDSAEPRRDRDRDRERDRDKSKRGGGELGRRLSDKSKKKVKYWTLKDDDDDHGGDMEEGEVDEGHARSRKMKKNIVDRLVGVDTKQLKRLKSQISTSRISSKLRVAQPTLPDDPGSDPPRDGGSDPASPLREEAGRQVGAEEDAREAVEQLEPQPHAAANGAVPGKEQAPEEVPPPTASAAAKDEAGPAEEQQQQQAGPAATGAGASTAAVQSATSELQEQILAIKAQLAQAERALQQSTAGGLAPESSGGDNHTVAVSGLPSTVNPLQVGIHFKQCGPVSKVILLSTQQRKPTGTAYVEFRAAHAVAKALALSQSKMDGHVIQVQQKEPGLAKLQAVSGQLQPRQPPAAAARPRAPAPAAYGRGLTRPAGRPVDTWGVQAWPRGRGTGSGFRGGIANRGRSLTFVRQPGAGTPARPGGTVTAVTSLASASADNSKGQELPGADKAALATRLVIAGQGQGEAGGIQVDASTSAARVTATTVLTQPSLEAAAGAPVVAER